MEKKTLKEFEEILSKDEALRNTYETECKKVAEAKEAANDAEVMVKAAGKLGFELSMSEFDRMKAGTEELNEEELENVTGGAFGVEDEYGHDGTCYVAWHCCIAFLHTEAEGNYYIDCWSNYECMNWYIE